MRPALSILPHRTLVSPGTRVPAQAEGMLAVHAVYGDRNFHEGKRDEADYVIHGMREVIGVVEGAG